MNLFIRRPAFWPSGAAAMVSSIILTIAPQSPFLRASAIARRCCICLRAISAAVSNSFLNSVGSHVPATTRSSGSSMVIGWPIHWTVESFTMNAVGMPFWPAASMYCLCVERSGSVASV